MKSTIGTTSRDRAWQLAIAGAVPFVLLAIAAFVLGQKNPVFTVLVDSLRTYGAVILSFLGGIRWGMALQAGEKRSWNLICSVAAPLVAWLAFFLTAASGIILLLVAFAGQGAWDSLSFHHDTEKNWFARLRIAMTCIVAASLLVTLLAFSRGG